MSKPGTEGAVYHLNSLDAALPDGPNAMKSGELGPADKPQGYDAADDDAPVDAHTFSDGTPVWVS